MTDNQSAAEAAYSTHIEPSAPLDAALPAGVPDAPPQEVKEAPKVEDKAAKPLTARETLSKALDAAEAKEKEAEEKAKVEKVEAKPEDKAAKPDEKAVEAKPEDKTQPDKADKSAAPAKDDATGQEGADKPRASEGRSHHEPPARFLPKAKEVWGNVPHAVKAEVARLVQEHDTELTQYRESHEFRQKLSKFEQMAKQHNTTIADALEDYTAVDGLLTANPVEGIRQVLARVGITPEQYAQHVLKNPQAHQAPVSRAPDPVQQQTSPEIEALRAEVEALKRDKQVEQTAPIVQAFAAAHEDYHALEPQIAEILGTGVIEKLYGTGLSPEQKLAEAYRMAGGKGPSSRSEPPLAAAAHSNANDRPVDPAGQKSIRGAPNGGQEPNDDPPETDIRALLKKEFRKAV